MTFAPARACRSGSSGRRRATRRRESVDEGVSELRIDYGPGCRVCFETQGRGRRTAGVTGTTVSAVLRSKG